MAAFFEQQAVARRNTRWLLLSMAGAVIATGAGLYGLIAGAQAMMSYARSRVDHELELWHPRLFAACLLVTALIVVTASAFRTLSLRGGGARIAELMGGRLVSGQPRDQLERRLLNVIEEMALASGVPVPQAFVLDLEQGINAFAAGFSLDDAAIAVTRGTLEKLTRSELQGVIGHEFSHVLNGDMRLNTRLMGTVYGILCVGLCGRALMRISASADRWSARRNKGGGWLFVIGLGVLLVGWIGELLGKLIRAAVSRQREYLADASAVQFTRDPQAVAGALKKIGGHSSGSNVLAPAAAEASHLFFGDLNRHFFVHSWLATHPPLRERILRLDPRFHGEFAPTPDGIAEPLETLAMAGFASEVRGGGAGAAATIVDQIGRPTRDALVESRRRLEQLPEPLHAAAANPFTACALVYALWLVDRPAAYRVQLERIGREAGPALRDEAARQAVQLSGLGYQERLSLIELSAPALRQLSSGQRGVFARTIEGLTRADDWTSLFEQVIGTMLTERLLGEPDAQARARVRHRKLPSVRSELELLLSLMAHAGAIDDGGSERGFEAAVSRLSGVKLSLLPVSEHLIRGLGPALTELRALAPELAERVVDACVHCVMSDRRVSVEESTLLRAICDALRCPLPLCLGESNTEQAAR
jgi:Zn-dependent protease with chaperone function